MCKLPPGKPWFQNQLDPKYEGLTLVYLDFEWQGLHFSDNFTWSISNKNPEEMRLFAIGMLEDLLGRDIDKYQPDEINTFCQRVVCEISKAIAGAEYFNNNPVLNLLQINQGLKGENIIRIKIDYKDQFVTIKDEFDWDLSNKLNE